MRAGPAGAVPLVVDLGEAEVDAHPGGFFSVRVVGLAHMPVKERCRGDSCPVGVVGPEGVGRDVEVVGWPTGLIAPVVVGESAVTDVDHRRVS